MANLTTTGLVLAAGGQAASVQAQPAAQPPPAANETKVTKITVQPGDYLSKIAKKYDTTWRRIYDANENIKHPDIIKPGDKLRIPDSDEEFKARPLAGQTVSKAASVSVSQNINYPTVSSGSVWDILAQCESGGNWGINSGNGFYGGLQFSLSTWRGVGGSGYPHQASKTEQIARAEILLARTGWGAWPACSTKLGF